MQGFRIRLSGYSIGVVIMLQLVECVDFPFIMATTRVDKW